MNKAERNELERLVLSFWGLSETNDLKYFSFERFFELFKAELEDKLAGHGRLSFQRYINFVGNKYYNLNHLDEFIYVSKHTGINHTKERLIEIIFLYRYLQARKHSSTKPAYLELEMLYNKLEMLPTDQYELVVLVDECINAMHSSGFILNIKKLMKLHNVRE